MGSRADPGPWVAAMSAPLTEPSPASVEQVAVEVRLIPLLKPQVDDRLAPAAQPHLHVRVDRGPGRFKIDLQVLGVIGHPRGRRRYSHARQPLGPTRGDDQAVGQFFQLVAGKGLGQAIGNFKKAVNKEPEKREPEN